MKCLCTCWSQTPDSINTTPKLQYVILSKNWMLLGNSTPPCLYNVYVICFSSPSWKNKPKTPEPRWVSAAVSQSCCIIYRKLHLACSGLQGRGGVGVHWLIFNHKYSRSMSDRIIWESVELYETITMNTGRPPCCAWHSFNRAKNEPFEYPNKIIVMQDAS